MKEKRKRREKEERERPERERERERERRRERRREGKREGEKERALHSLKKEKYSVLGVFGIPTLLYCFHENKVDFILKLRKRRERERENFARIFFWKKKSPCLWCVEY